MDEWVRACVSKPDDLNLILGIYLVEELTPALTSNVPCSMYIFPHK